MSSSPTPLPGIFQPDFCMGLPGDSDGKESACNIGDLGLIPKLGRFPRRREWLPTPVFLPREFHGQRKLAGCNPGGFKELGMTEQLTLSLIPTSQVSGLVSSSKRSHLVSQSKEDSGPQLFSVASLPGFFSSWKFSSGELSCIIITFTFLLFAPLSYLSLKCRCFESSYLVSSPLNREPVILSLLNLVVLLDQLEVLKSKPFIKSQIQVLLV